MKLMRVNIRLPRSVCSAIARRRLFNFLNFLHEILDEILKLLLKTIKQIDFQLLHPTKTEDNILLASMPPHSAPPSLPTLQPPMW